MGAQVAGQDGSPDDMAQPTDQMLGGAGGGEVDAGQHLQLQRLTVLAQVELLTCCTSVTVARLAASRPIAVMFASYLRKEAREENCLPQFW